MCQACRESLEGKFQEVKEYIRSHPGVGIPEVSKACDVEPSQIRQWLREERLEVTEDSPIFLTCEVCGESAREDMMRFQNGKVVCLDCFKGYDRGWM